MARTMKLESVDKQIKVLEESISKTEIKLEELKKEKANLVESKKTIEVQELLDIIQRNNLNIETVKEHIAKLSEA